MKPFGWVRPLSRNWWSLAPDWRESHRYMSNQALGLGTATLTVLVALELFELLLPVLYVTVAFVLSGTLIKQRELDDE